VGSAIVSSTNPMPVLGITHVRDLYAFYDVSCAIEEFTDKLFCWGANASGQLGLGDTEYRLAPAPVVLD
jgi:alpha-tubulin suppressor-like RCC1 family protein